MTSVLPIVNWKTPATQKKFFKTNGLLFLLFFPRTPLKKPAAAWRFQPDHQQSIWVIFSNKHESTKQSFEKKNVGSYIIFPKTRLVSASGSDKRETNNSWVKLQLWVWLDFNSALKKCHEKNCPLSCVICFRKKKNFKHGDGCLHLLISTKKRIKITQMSQNMTFALKW